jgi:endonuclease/exonuclease/phosphatase family metal-dependent hydrolase
LELRLRILSWNIQWGLGVDGQGDPARIVSEIRRLGDPDIICLQEVTSGFDDLHANDGHDQFAFFAAAFPGHTAIAAPALDIGHTKGGRKRFGNLILSRLPVGPVFRFALPWLTVPGRECMPRGMVSATVTTPNGPLRIMTTHLEYSSPVLREAQIDAIREFHRQCCLRVATPPPPGKGSYAPQLETTSAILIGDFNMPPDEPSRQRLMEPLAGHGISRFCDAFETVNPGKVHPPSMCLFDQADGPPRCLDYAFCTEDLTAKLAGVTYDQVSQASDHQPLVMELR